MKQTETRPAAGGPPDIVTKGRELLDWVMGLRVVRAIQRYGNARGAQLSGGVAYSAIFAIAGVLTLGLTAFSYALGGHAQVRENLFDSIDSALPGILKTAETPNGLLNPDSLIVDDPLNVTTIIALLVLVWTSVSLMGGIRSTVQAMFGLTGVARHPVVTKLFDLSGFLVLSLAVLVTTLLVSATHLFATPVFDFLGLPVGASRIFVTGASYAISLAIDGLVIMFLIRVMSGVRAPLGDLLIGAVFGAFGSGILRFAGTSVVSSVSKNVLLAPFAAIITLLLWVNLLARLLLLSSCVTANPPAPGISTSRQPEHLRETPNYVTDSVPKTKEWTYDPRSGAIAPDPAHPKMSVSKSDLKVKGEE